MGRAFRFDDTRVLWSPVSGACLLRKGNEQTDCSANLILTLLYLAWHRTVCHFCS